MSTSAQQTVKLEFGHSLPLLQLAKIYHATQSVPSESSSRIVQFASTHNGSSAGEIAFETAVFAATVMSKRVVFIDGAAEENDIPEAARKLRSGLKTSLADIAQSEKTLSDGLVSTTGMNLSYAFLASPQKQKSILTSESIATLFALLRESYDLIIIHSTALLNHFSSAAMAHAVDGSILVIEAGHTRAPVALEAKKTIEASGGRVIGAVLNNRRYPIPDFLYRWL